ncbi:glycosyltransferase [Lactiplantibacillus plantarum]|uniref:glycosyltransferase n=1 Tax=Lactiplantibacillus plantarum TaxID=1590 RepID=UPI000788AD3F|nr:glycosyltransferase [Lactiplantibacillus plantarum]ASX21140.1 hypothetical protein BGV74_04830 [Lactiplantibacillus plantarum]KYK51882.1 hypothetical protein AYO51_06260 [Lactiplantibacillus plantarum]KYM69366.1 hypothetical protein AZJ01_12075 [Lactiplantibacillus plantarum]KZE02526.1 Exopolysaccharide biosynthesis glycosyltransferase EpsF [Lactiplantibacillus plantarum]MBE1726924.1 glycosyltransferase [Lactiplantibacillus plantarum]
MIRVLEVCESYGGGVKKHVDYLHKYLDRDEYRSFFLVSGARNNADVPDAYIRNDSLSKYKNPIMILKSLITIARLVNKYNIQVIHAHSTIAAVLVYLFSVLTTKRLILVYTPHAYLSEKNLSPLKKKILIVIERMYIQKYNYVINVSQQEKEHAVQCRLSSVEKQLVIKNGILSETVPRVRCQVKHVINIARCDEQKNPFEFIRIANKLEKIDDLSFTFVGDGELLNDCREYVKRLGLTNINFVGFSKNVVDWLQNADLFLSTSLYEGLPFSVIEAEAAGLPVLLTDVVGHNELYRNNGFLYKLNDVASAAEWINSVRMHTELIKEYSQNSVKVYQENYTLNKMIREIENVYSGGI